MEKLFGKTVTLLTSFLDYRSSRHNVIASNISNIDTPGYAPKEVYFDDAMSQAMESKSVTLTRTDDNHLTHDGGMSRENDYRIEKTGSEVDLDTEMARLAENHLMYNLSVELLARKFRGLETVLKEVK